MKTPGLWKGTAAQGHMPSMGVKMAIEDIERRETGENAQTPGCLSYRVNFRVLEPAQYKGRRLNEFFTIGTAEDKKAKKDETWDRPEQGPGRLLRCLEKADVANSDDDDDWMKEAEDKTLFAHVGIETFNGQQRNKVLMYFGEKDEEFVGVGEELAAPAPGKGERKKARGGDGNGKSARGASARRPADDDEDEKDDENGDDEKESKSARSSRRDKDDDEDDTRSKRAARGRRDEDED